VCDIFNHEIVKIAGMATHFLQFYDDCDCTYAYNDRGEFITASDHVMRWPGMDRDGNYL
jgi:hypothetical protein